MTFSDRGLRTLLLLSQGVDAIENLVEPDNTLAKSEITKLSKAMRVLYLNEGGSQSELNAIHLLKTIKLNQDGN